MRYILRKFARYLVASAIAAVAVGLLFIQANATGVGVALAQGRPNTAAPGVWSSSINLQNTSSSIANVSIAFFQSDGTPANIPNYTPSPLGPNGAVSIFVPALVSGLTAGQYSAVVSSDQQLVATVNTGSTGSASPPWTIFAYEGSGAGGSPIYFPGLYNNYFGFSSEFVLQNAGSSATDARATFFNTAGSVVATANLGTIQPNGAKTFPLASLATTPALPSGNTAKFGLVVTSTSSVPLVGIANLWKTGSNAGTGSYNAYTAGSSTIYAPALYNNYFNFVSSFTIQNVHASQAANVTLTYGNGVQTNTTLAPGASIEYFQPNQAGLPSGNTNGVFSAKATAVGGSIVGLVNVNATNNGSFASYNTPLQATTQVRIANINKDYFGFFSAVTVQNTSGTPTTITINYPGALSVNNKSFANVGPNQTVNIIHLSPGSTLPSSTSTSATITSSPAVNIVAVVQHNTASGVVGYNPAKQPADFLLATTGVPQ